MIGWLRLLLLVRRVKAGLGRGVFGSESRPALFLASLLDRKSLRPKSGLKRAKVNRLSRAPPTPPPPPPMLLIGGDG